MRSMNFWACGIVCLIAVGCSAMVEMCPGRLRDLRPERPSEARLQPPVPIYPRKKLEPVPDPAFSRPLRIDEVIAEPADDQVVTLPSVNLPETPGPVTPVEPACDETDQDDDFDFAEDEIPAAGSLEVAPGTGRAVAVAVAVVALAAAVLFRSRDKEVAQDVHEENAEAGGKSAAAVGDSNDRPGG